MRDDLGAVPLRALMDRDKNVCCYARPKTQLSLL